MRAAGSAQAAVTTVVVWLDVDNVADYLVEMVMMERKRCDHFGTAMVGLLMRKCGPKGHAEEH